MPSLDKLLDGLRKAIDALWELLRRYGPVRGTGLVLLFVDLTLHAAYALLGLKDGVEKLSPLAVVGGVFALVAFALLAYDGGQRVQEPTNRPDPGPDGASDQQLRKLEEMGRQVFGQLSLLERGEEDRRRVAEVVAVANFLGADRPDTYDFGSFFRDLLEFMELFAPESKDALAGNALTFREKLREKPRTMAVQPRFLEGYIQGLIGISYLAEVQTHAAGTRALEHIDNAVQTLGDKVARVGSLLNARAICYALLSRDGAPIRQRVAHTANAVSAFAKAEQAEPGNPQSIYRFHVNFIEWSVQTFGLWQEWSGAPDGNFNAIPDALSRLAGEPTFSHLFEEVQGRLTAERVIDVLFCSACKALEIAKSWAVDGRLGPHRPVLHLNTFYLGVAVRVAQKLGNLGQGVICCVGCLPDTEEGLVDELATCVRLWQDRCPAATVATILEELPYLRKVWLPDLPNVEAGYIQIMQSLGPVQNGAAHQHDAIPGPHVAAAGVGP